MNLYEIPYLYRQINNATVQYHVRD